MLDEEDFLFSKDEADTALRYWHVREEFHRMVIENRIEDLDLYIKRRDEIEQKLTQEVSGLDMKNPNPDTLKAVSYTHLNPVRGKNLCSCRNIPCLLYTSRCV